MQWLIFANLILEDPANYSVTQVKKKAEDIDTKEVESDEREISVREDVEFKAFDPQPCSCVYQHAREITERKPVLENPPCPCLLNFKRKCDTCPCLTKSNGKEFSFFFIIRRSRSTVNNL